MPFAVPTRASRPFDVAGFGLNTIDLVAVVAEYPVSNTLGSRGALPTAEEVEQLAFGLSL